MDLGYFTACLPVKDIAASLAFYEALGFETVNGGVDIRTVTLKRGDCRLGLYQGYLHPDRVQLIFWQGDIDALAQTVTSHGLGFVNPPRRDETGSAFMIEDPDSHPMMFINMHGVTREQPDPTAAMAG